MQRRNERERERERRCSCERDGGMGERKKLKVIGREEKARRERSEIGARWKRFSHCTMQWREEDDQLMEVIFHPSAWLAREGEHPTRTYGAHSAGTVALAEMSPSDAHWHRGPRPRAGLQ